MNLRKLQSSLHIKYVKAKATIPKIIMLIINIIYVVIWAIGIMLVLNIFLQTGLGLIQLTQSMALYFLIEQIKPWILKLNIYR